MALNGIDISSWQSGINLAVVPCDFVVIKATEGTGYVNPDYERAYRQAKTAGKCLGIYHYANGGNIQAEADYFLANVGNRLGEAILILDWEAGNNASFGSCDYAWCKGWLDYVYQKTGVHPILYCSQSISYKFDNIGNYGLWIAQYADNDPTGYQDVPWNEGEYTCAIRQYTSCGRLSGYAGNLDLDKFYGSKEDWGKYAVSDKTNVVVPEQPETPKPATASPGRIYIRSGVQDHAWRVRQWRRPNLESWNSLRRDTELYQSHLGYEYRQSGTRSIIRQIWKWRCAQDSSWKSI